MLKINSNYGTPLDFSIIFPRSVLKLQQCFLQVESWRTDFYFNNYNSLINEYWKQIFIAYRNFLQILAILVWYYFRKWHHLSISLDVLSILFWWNRPKSCWSIKALHSSKGTSFLIAFHNSAEVRRLWWQTLNLKNAHKRSQVDKYGYLGGDGLSLFLETDNDPQSKII